jgi:hypothetical protein
MFRVGFGQRMLTVLQHACERQELFAKPSSLLQDLVAKPFVFLQCSAQVVFQVTELRLGNLYPLVTGLDDTNYFGEVILCRRGILSRRIGS